ncbi:hypothetical protein [Rhizobium johnstonii]|uniref:hypothetical protein n=1 Tax=Rhizobium johnstonii TaxID=3019933 RepID=UPI003F9E0AAB
MNILQARRPAVRGLPITIRILAEIQASASPIARSNTATVILPHLSQDIMEDGDILISRRIL